MFERMNTAADVSVVSSRRWISLFAMIIVGSILIIFAVFPVLIGPLNQQFGWAEAGILLVYTLMTWSFTPASIIGGKFRDVYGDKPALLVAAILYGLGCCINFFNSNLIIFIITLGLLTGSGVAIARLSISHRIAVLFPDKPGLTTGLFWGGMSIIQALLIPSVSMLAMQFSPGVALLILGAAGTIIGILALPLIVTPPEDYNPGGAVPEMTEDAPVDDGSVQINIDWKQWIKMPSLYLVLLGFLGTAIITEALYSNVALIAQQMTGMSELEAATMGSVLTFAIGVGSIVLGFISDRLGPFRSASLIAILVSIAIFASLAIGVTTPVFTAIVVVVGFSIGASQMLMPVVVMTFGEENFGVNYGIATCIFIVTSLVCPQLTIILPMTTYFLIGACSCAIAAVAFLFAKKSVDKYKAKLAEEQTA